jgi:hypothetical protein
MSDAQIMFFFFVVVCLVGIVPSLAVWYGMRTVPGSWSQFIGALFFVALGAYTFSVLEGSESVWKSLLTQGSITEKQLVFALETSGLWKYSLPVLLVAIGSELIANVIIETTKGAGKRRALTTGSRRRRR